VPDMSRRYSSGLGVGPTEFRGVAIDQDSGIIYGSDMRSGLWILRPSRHGHPHRDDPLERRWQRLAPRHGERDDAVAGGDAAASSCWSRIEVLP
jgi:hypothetical protein